MNTRQTQPTILVVEDEYFIADDIKAALTQAGARVLGPVPTAAEGLALLDGDPAPDFAVLDISLRDVPVYPLADELRRRGIPFVFATGYDFSAIPALYRDVERVEKPFEIKHFVEEVKAALVGSDARPAFK